MMKYEKDLEKRFITEETKSNLKNLKQDIEKSKLLIANEIVEMKKTIREEAEKRPEILEYDEKLVKELRNGKGMEKFLKTNTIKIIDEKYFNIPELNKIFLRKSYQNHLVNPYGHHSVIYLHSKHR